MTRGAAILLGMLGTGCPDGETEASTAPPSRQETPRATQNAEDGFTAPLRLDDTRVRTTDPTDLTSPPRPCRAPELVRVRRVIDGDTIDVQRENAARERVRLIGVDTPELDHRGGQNECFAHEATEFTQRLNGRLVWLTFDRECQDRYDRVLAYVHVGPETQHLWERQLIRRGFAEALVIPPNDHFARQLRRDERAARRSGAGRWSQCR